MYKTMTVVGNNPTGYVFRDNVSYKMIGNVLKQIHDNNVYFPKITNIIFNLKTEDTKPAVDVTGKKILETYTTKKGETRTRVKRETVKLENPMLTTVVYFEDKSKSVVVNSAKDKLTLVERVINQDEIDLAKKLGKEEIKPITILDADDASKENGIVYAIFKRVYGIPSAETKVEGNRRISEGTVTNSGTSQIIRDLVNNSFDTNYEAAVKKTQTRVNIMLAEQAKKEAAEAKAKVEAIANKRMVEYAKSNIRAFLEALSSEDLKDVIKEIKAKIK